MVLRAGIEPSTLALKGLCPKPLDDRSFGGKCRIRTYGP